MPATLPRPNEDSDPRLIQFGAILEKIRRGGSNALSPNERVLIVELFRAAAITRDTRVLRLRDEIQTAHLEFCFRLPPTETHHDA